MTYEVVMPYHLHMPSYFLGTFTEYPYLMCYLWVDAAKDRDNDKRYHEYFQEMDKQKSGEYYSPFFCLTFESLLCEFVAFVEPKTNN